MNASPRAYWLIFASMPRSRWSSLASGGGVGPPLAEHPGEAVGARDPVGAGAVHRDVAVALEQAHQPADLVEHLALGGAGQQRGEAAVVERLATVAQVVEHLRERVEEPLRVGVDGVERLLDEAEVVLAEPRHAGELRPVGDLVQRQPQPELLRREGEPLLEGEHVRADVVHEVLVVGRRLGRDPRPRAGRTDRAPASTSSRAACRPRRRRTGG